MDRLIINVDGASRGNPGPAAIGVTLKDALLRPLANISQSVGRTTNNQAEYRAMIAGLKKAIELGAQDVQVKSDSELLVRQICGSYRVKNKELKPLYEEVKRLASSFKHCEVIYIPRELNYEADRLANSALDKTQ